MNIEKTGYSHPNVRIDSVWHLCVLELFFSVLNTPMAATMYRQYHLQLLLSYSEQSDYCLHVSTFVVNVPWFILQTGCTE